MILKGTNFDQSGTHFGPSGNPLWFCGAPASVLQGTHFGSSGSLLWSSGEPTSVYRRTDFGSSGNRLRFFMEPTSVPQSFGELTSVLQGTNFGSAGTDFGPSRTHFGFLVLCPLGNPLRFFRGTNFGSSGNPLRFFREPTSVLWRSNFGSWRN